MFSLKVLTSEPIKQACQGTSFTKMASFALSISQITSAPGSPFFRRASECETLLLEADA